MIKFFTRCFTLALLLALGATNGNAQSVFFTEDFDGGLPSDWTSVVRLGNNQPSSAWFHTTEGPTGAFATDPLASTTAANGWMIFDSDLNCNIGVGQDAWLISPVINASDKAIVYLRFETYYRRFLDVVNIRVGTNINDLNSWATIDLFPGLANNQFGGGSAAVNPTLMEVNLTQWAAGQSAVYFAFQFLSTPDVAGGDIGCAYAWQVDDVELTDQDLTIQNDMQVNSFFARAPNAVTPASQLESFGFIADVQNNGAQSAQSSTLTVSIKDADNTEVFTSSIQYGSIASDSTAENVFFPTEFTPPSTPGELYTGSYTISLVGATDEEPDNNARTFQFAVSDTTFSKEFGTGLVGLRYGGADGQTRSYSWGNIYYVPNGTGYGANSVSFFLANADELAGRTISTFLYRWDGDVNEDDQINIAELAGGAPIAFNSYEIAGDETGLITIPVDLDGNQIALEDGYHYFIAVQYATEDNQFMFMAATQQLDYSGMWFYSDSLNRPRYAAAADVGNTGTYFLTFNAVPVIRLNIGPLTSTKEPTLAEGSVSVFPNPANEEVKVAFSLETPSAEVELSIMDMSGKVIRTEQYQNLYRDQLTVNTANLPAGAYNIRVRTQQGVSVQRIAVQH